jgi:putative ABC transport system permease protein
VYVDPAFFSMFDFTIEKGNLLKAFTTPNAVLITREIAQKYFQEENPIGKALHINIHNGSENLVLQVEGILQDSPTNSHFHFNIFLPYQQGIIHQSSVGVYSYLLLSAQANPEEVIKKYTVLKKSYAQAWQIEPKVSIGLQPLPSIHLHSHFLDEIEPNGNIQIVYIFMITAALILLVACINYVNIALARSTKRFKEVGMRKILGADKKQITTQFLIESSLSLFLAMGVAILLVELGLPLFTELAGKPLDVNYWQYITYLLPLLLTVGLLSSLYPAVILGSFAPAQAIKNLTPIKSIKGASIRKALQTFQFVIATLLIICTGTIYQQLSYIKVKNLGFRKDQILLISLQAQSYK